MAAVQPELWLWALITNNNNNAHKDFVQIMQEDGWVSWSV
jgi:hypothetical protein